MCHEAVTLLRAALLDPLQSDAARVRVGSIGGSLLYFASGWYPSLGISRCRIMARAMTLIWRCRSSLQMRFVPQLHLLDNCPRPHIAVGRAAGKTNTSRP